MEQFKYIGADGKFDYDHYRRVQQDGNRRKIDFQWVDEASIIFLSAEIRKRIALPRFGICHGTRRGNEQMWFSRHLGDCVVIGTEISDTAQDFPRTVQWDFHNPRDEWVGSADFVYSNSWDHSFDPPRMFKVWADQLRRGGLLILEHTHYHLEANELDPFGANPDELLHLLLSIDGQPLELDTTLVETPGIMFNGTQHIETTYVLMRRT